MMTEFTGNKLTAYERYKNLKLSSDKCFNDTKELWQWLIDGGEIEENHIRNGRRVRLIGGNPVYTYGAFAGQGAEECLFRFGFWDKYIEQTI